VRVGQRTKEDFDDLAVKIVEAWNDIVNGQKAGNEESELKAVFIVGEIVAGVEAGFVLPKVC
jgi:F0F1-type ATP synthase assembly protein I